MSRMRRVSARSSPRLLVRRLLVAQLAYHQSSMRLLTSVMPHVSELLAKAEEEQQALEAQREASKSMRASMPQPSDKTHLVIHLQDPHPHSVAEAARACYCVM